MYLSTIALLAVHMFVVIIYHSKNKCAANKVPLSLLKIILLLNSKFLIKI